ncbi:MAG: hypothetical protein QXK12_04915 [Candidatus Nezhaarchaeales archaeon]
MSLRVGIDVNGTRIDVVVLDQSGRLAEAYKTPTRRCNHRDNKRAYVLRMSKTATLAIKSL